MGLSAAILTLLSTTAMAQSAGSLPPVTIDPPVQRRAAPRVAPRAAARPAATPRAVARSRPRAAAPRVAARPVQPVAAVAAPSEPIERAGGPVPGMVAKRTATGTKTDTPIIETPNSISVIPRQQIEQQGAENVSAALRYTAGVVPETRTANNRYDSIYVRGFGGAGTNAAYVNYWDGMRILRGRNYLVPAIDPYSLERIEVMRGPASVLFGQVNIGGLVNLVSKRPTEVPFREIQLQTGSYGRLQGAFDLSGPATEDGRLLYRLTGLVRDANTQTAYTGEQRIMFSPSFTWKPDESTKLTVHAHYQRDPETGYYTLAPALGTVFPTRFGKFPTRFFLGEPGAEGFSRNQAHVGYEFEHKPADGVTLRQNLRLVDMDSKFLTVSTGGLLADQQTLLRRITYSREFARGLVMDNQAQFDFQTGPLQHKVLVGLDYLNINSNTTESFGGSASSLNWLFPIYGRPINFAPLSRSTQTQTQLGLYAQDQIKFDRLVVTAGVRQDWANTKQLTYPFNRTNAGDQATTGRVGAVYLFDNGLAPYANYSTSFDPLTTGTSFTRAPFKPTTGEQYEAGIKYQPVGYNAFIQASAYDLTQNNVTTPDPTNIGFSVQTGQIRSRGVEVEGRATIARNLDLIASYSTMDVEITRANDGSLGRRPVGAPAHTASGWAYYTFREGWFAGLGFGGGVRYIGSTYGQNNPALTGGIFKVPDFTLFDAAVSYDFGATVPSLRGLRFAVNATNLADKIYVAGCFNYAGGCNYGYRRAVLGTLTYRW